MHTELVRAEVLRSIEASSSLFEALLRQLGEYLPDNISVYVGQPERSPLIMEGESFVV